MKKTLGLILLLAFGFCAGVPCRAEQPKTDKLQEQKLKRWRNIFPIGTTVHSFACAPRNNNIYASTPDGLFVSVNDGKLWNCLTPYHGRNWSVIKVSPSAPDIMYLGFEDSIFKSKDGGVRWERIGASISKEVRAIELDSKSPEILYVQAGNNLYKTLNGGKTFGKITPEKPEGGIKGFSISKTSPDEISAVVSSSRYIKLGGDGDLMYSGDGGLTWSEKPLELQVKQRGRYAKTDWISWYQDFGDGITACGAGANVFFSADSAHLFLSLEGAVPQDVGPFQRVESERTSYSDQDDNLRLIPTTSMMVAQKTAYAATPIGVFALSNIQEGWKNITPKRFGTLKVLNIFADSKNNLYINSDYGVFRSSDGGVEWEQASYGLPVTQKSLELSSVNAKTGAIRVLASGSVWESLDNGVTWNKGSETNVVQSILCDDSTEYQLVRDDSENYYGSRPGEVNMITPQGKKTKLRIEGSPDFLAAALSDSQTIYAVFNDRIAKSEDAGFSWEDLDWKSSLSLKNENNKITILSVDPQSSATVYAVVEHPNSGSDGRSGFNFLKTVDGGKNWTELRAGVYKAAEDSWENSKWLNPQDRPYLISLLLANPSAVTVDPSDSKRVFFTVPAGGVFNSDDGGLTWKITLKEAQESAIAHFDRFSAEISKGRKNPKVRLDVSLSEQDRSMLPGNVVVIGAENYLNSLVKYKSVSINPADSKNIFVSSLRILRSADSGATWETLTREGFTDSIVNRGVVASRTGFLVNGSTGIYELFEPAE